MKDVIYRQDATNALKEIIKNVSNNYTELDPMVMAGCGFIEDCIYELESLPSAQQEYKPVTMEDFAKTLSENTLYGFMAWHGEAFTLIKEMGFEICKKTM